MRRKRILTGWALAATLFVAAATFATTWAENDFVCPLCRTKNTFRVITSFGGYIYYWPERFQFVFWPYTDKNVLYHCKQCRFTAFLSDFEKPPAEKVDVLRDTLKSVTVRNDAKDYAEIPMWQRLEIAERVYALYGLGDTFWCHFYRVKAYHYDDAQMPTEATASRQKALELALKMLEDKEQAGKRKENYLIAAAITHFLGDDAGALRYLDLASKLTVEDSKLKPEQNRNADSYLTELIRDYISILRAGGPTPRNPGKKE